MIATIREARLSDLAAVHAVEHNVFDTPGYPLFFFRQAFDLWPRLFLVAAAETGGIAAYTLACPGTITGEAWVLSLAVQSQHRGHGLGRELMHALLAALDGHRYTYIKLTVTPGSPACELYRSLGFTVVDEEADYFGDQQSRLLMGLSL